jgi:hypothetical protein
MDRMQKNCPKDTLTLDMPDQKMQINNGTTVILKGGPHREKTTMEVSFTRREKMTIFYKSDNNYQGM